MCCCAVYRVFWFFIVNLYSRTTEELLFLHMIEWKVKGPKATNLQHQRYLLTVFIVCFRCRCSSSAVFVDVLWERTYFHTLKLLFKTIYQSLSFCFLPFSTSKANVTPTISSSLVCVCVWVWFLDAETVQEAEPMMTSPPLCSNAHLEMLKFQKEREQQEREGRVQTILAYLHHQHG